jgi:hypothetical protein
VRHIYLDYSLHPKLNTQYFFPKRQADLTVPNARRNSAFIIPGGGGPANPRGNAPFDRDLNVITYAFQLNPIGDGTSVDSMRDAFLVAVDHGLPQTLAFRTDTGEHWFAQCIMVSSPHHQTANSDASHTIEASWLMLDEYIKYPAPPGVAIYGNYTKYGMHAQYGAKADKLQLTTSLSNVMYLDNTAATTGATAPTTDAVITLTGPFGDASNPTTYPIAVYCAEAQVGFYVMMTLNDNDYLSVDLGSRRALLTPAGGQNPQPAFQYLRKIWPTPNWLLILPDQVNSFVVINTAGGNPLAVQAPAPPDTGSLATLQWRPKRSL